MKPATDLFHTCQQNASLLMKSANMLESVKFQRLKDAQVHLDLVRIQRQPYNNQCAAAKDNLPESGSQPSACDAL